MRVVIAAILLFLNVAFTLWMAYGDGSPRQAGVVSATDAGIASLDLLADREPVAGTLSDTASVGAPPAAPSTRPGIPEAAPSTEMHPPPQPPPAASSAVETESPRQQQCRVVGVYTDRRSAESAVERLVPEAVDAYVAEMPVAERRYWVYLPPFASRSAAFEGERELQRRGIEDLQVLAGDDKQNGISLGLYRDLAVAERRLQQLRELGYAPDMDVIERKRPYYWIELPIRGDPATPPAWLGQLTGSDRRVEIRACSERKP